MSRETTAAIARPSSPLACALVDAGLVERRALEDVLAEGRPRRAGLVAALLDRGVVDEIGLADFLTRRYHVRRVSPLELESNPPLLDLVGERLARRHDVLPIAR